MKTNKLGFALVLTFILAGCGGGGGGSGGATFGESSTDSFRNTFEKYPAETRAAVKLSAQSDPVAGSVTQGNIANPINVDVSHSDGKFTYQVTEKDTNRLVIARNDGGQGHDPFTVIKQERDGDDAFLGASVRKEVEGGVLTVSVLTDYDVPEDNAAGGDNDYLAGGFWVFTPTEVDANNPIRIAAFVDGNKPFVVGMSHRASQASAIYNGKATGIFVTGEDAESELNSFEGDVSLTADFGDETELGTVAGEISGGDMDGRVINLGSADITESTGGFFKGDTMLISGRSGALTGKWGGQFYGGESDGKPEGIAGTFGGATGEDTERYLSYLGFFAAELPDDDESSVPADNAEM